MADKVDNLLETAVDDDFLLDDLDDLPSFVAPPTGAYIVSLDKGIEDRTLEDKKTKEDRTFYNVPMTIVSVEEVNQKDLDEGEVLPKEGDSFNILYDRSHRVGMGVFKQNFLVPIAEKFGLKKVGEVKEASKGIQMLVIIKRTYDKDKDRHNVNIKKSAVL